MYTVCSKCNLNLAITVADLRAAQGYVRCGGCQNVFNALTALSDEPVAFTDTVTPADMNLPPAAGTGLRPPQAAVPAQPAPGTPPRPAVTGSAAPPPAAASRPAAGSTAPRSNNPVMPAAAADREAAHALALQQTAAARFEPPAPRPRPAPTSPEPDAVLEFDPISTDVKRIFVEPAPEEATGTFEAIVLESEDTGAPAARSGAVDPRAASPADAGAAPVNSGVEAASERAADEAAAGAAASQASAPAAPLQAAAGAEPPHTEPGSPAQLEQEAAAALAGLSRPAAVISRGTRALLYLAALALALVLGAQILHHYRSQLAGYAPLSRPMTALYAALGLPLDPRWDVSAYDVRQLGADESAAAGALTVRASLRNTATRAQPLPLLRVTVQDRFGNRLAARDVRPDEYLPNQGGLMAAGQRLDTQVSFVDPGPQVAGFEIDACLRLSSGRTVCANDPGR